MTCNPNSNSSVHSANHDSFPTSTPWIAAECEGDACEPRHFLSQLCTAVFKDDRIIRSFSISISIKRICVGARERVTRNSIGSSRGGAARARVECSWEKKFWIFDRIFREKWEVSWEVWVRKFRTKILTCWENINGHVKKKKNVIVALFVV